MKYPIVPVLCLLAAAAHVRALAAGREAARMRPAAILRSKEGWVQVRCSHTPGRDWRGILLHAGDTVEVRRGAWASVSLEATGARYLLAAGSSVRIEPSRLSRLYGPVPQRGYDTPRREPASAGKGQKSPGDGEDGTKKPENEPGRERAQEPDRD